jgi:signal peptide peptidase SppA
MNLIDEIRPYLPARWRESNPVVAVLPLAGVISARGRFSQGLNLHALAPRIERAFKLKHLKAVVLAINSPGGSPVQSALIAGRIRELATENKVPVYAFIEDVGASGGYWLACAADEIYAEASSIVGSIGVVSGSFGFTEMIAKLGIERRLHTAGDKKAMLDPFSPEKAADVKHLKALQADIHDDFKQMVRSRRGDRLKADDKELFSGAFWTGRKALELGLVDGLGSVRPAMRERFGEAVKLRLIDERRSWWRRRFGGASAGAGEGGFGFDLGGALIQAVEERLRWNRFGL